jgi:hypothetical protein
VDGQLARLETRPSKIAQFLPSHPDIFVLPFYGESIVLNFRDRAQPQTAIESLNRAIDTVEKVDPWVKETFGIEGLGEGLVFYPESDNRVERLSYAELLFKAKGEKHKVVKTKEPIQFVADVQKESVAELAAAGLTWKEVSKAVMNAAKEWYQKPVKS